MRCFIISQPKAGTYLCSNLLVELGLHQTGMHISEKEFQQYDLSDLAACRRNPGKYQINKPLQESVQFIPENSFAVGHIPYKDNVEILKPFKKILLLRNDKSIEDSAKRWSQLVGRHLTGKGFVAKAKRVKPWEKESDVFVLQFTDMIKKNVDAIDNLQLYLFDEIKYDSRQAILTALEKPSLTKSKIR